MARLIVHEEDREWVHEIVADVTTVGRSSRNDVGLPDTASSRFHCEIRRNGSGFTLVDLGSKNGTRHNGRRIGRVEEAKLQPGDQVLVGNTLILFDPGDPDSLKDTVSLAAEAEAGAGAGESELASLPEEAQQEIQELHRERAALLRLLEVNRGLAGELDLRRLLELVVDTAIEITGAERGFLLIDEGGPELRVRVARSSDKEAVRKAPDKVSHTIASNVLQDGRPVVTSDASSDERFQASGTVQNLELRSVMAAPLVCRGQKFGVIYVDNRFQEKAFAGRHLRWLELLAAQAAIALENARLFECAASRQEVIQAAKEKLVEVQPSAVEEIPAATPWKTRPKGKSRPALKYPYKEIITNSPKMYDIFKLLDRVIDSDVPVLITGESGTGKELIAQAIHIYGKRKSKPFVSQNCAAIPATLMEGEFFGHMKGSFTGAHRDKLGLFEMAHTGTIFLDEIGDMRLDIQTKFLRVLQEGEVRRVGGKGVVHVDVRVVSATNRDLAALVKAHQFREDLYYRLNVISFVLPPLRERKEDIPMLVEFFLKHIAGGNKDREPKRMDAEVIDYLIAYDWPGNIRELQNEIERCYALSGEVILTSNLSENVREAAGAPGGRPKPPTGTLEDIAAAATAKAEREAIAEALKSTNWVKSHAAKKLGISRPTLDAKLEKYGFSREFFDLLRE